MTESINLVPAVLRWWLSQCRVKPPHSRTFFRWDPAQLSPTAPNCSPDLHSLVIRRLQPAQGWLKYRLEGAGGCWRVVEGGGEWCKPENYRWLAIFCLHPGSPVMMDVGLCWPWQMVSGHSGLTTLHAVWLSDIKMLKLDFNCSQEQEFPHISTVCQQSVITLVFKMWAR